MPGRRLSLGLAVGWMGVLFWLSHQPSLPTPELFPGQDKLFHAIVYAILGALLLGATRFRPPAYRRRQILLAVAIASLYGISDEFHQYFVPGRSADVLDWVADTLGAWLAVVAAARLAARWRR